jgi:hypothetical protein
MRGVQGLQRQRRFEKRKTNRPEDKLTEPKGHIITTKEHEK